jgi:hypothetical protein
VLRIKVNFSRRHAPYSFMMCSLDIEILGK